MLFQELTKVVAYVIGKDLIPKDHSTNTKSKTSATDLVKKQPIEVVELTDAVVSLTVTARRENLKKDMVVVSMLVLLFCITSFVVSQANIVC